MEVDCVDRVAELTGFLYENVSGHFIGTENRGCNNKV